MKREIAYIQNQANKSNVKIKTYKMRYFSLQTNYSYKHSNFHRNNYPTTHPFVGNRKWHM